MAEALDALVTACREAAQKPDHYLGAEITRLAVDGDGEALYWAIDEMLGWPECPLPRSVLAAFQTVQAWRE